MPVESNPVLDLRVTQKVMWCLVGFLVLRSLFAIDTIKRDSATTRTIERIAWMAENPRDADIENFPIENFQESAMENGLRNRWLTLLSFPATVLFLWFLYRAYENLAFLKVSGQKYSSVWAVCWFFIPGLNLIRPFDVMRELWRASDPAVLDETAWKRSPATPLIAIWWMLFVLAFFGRPASLLMAASGEIAAVPGIMHANLFFETLEIPAAIAAIYVVWRIEQRQREKYARLIQTGAPA